MRMKKIRKNKKTKASREFWKDFPVRKKCEVLNIPSIGESLWESENKLSPYFLSNE